MQTTSKVFMVKPIRFGYNPQTAGNNAFQKRGFEKGAQDNALREFLSFTALLKANGITVVMAEDTEIPFTPDSIFPNNWFSTHDDGTLVLYPMFAPNRRKERKEVFLDLIKKNINVTREIDLTSWEEKNKFLEGTGSMIFNRENKIVYACRSPRTDDEVMEDFCNQLGYTPIIFDATDEDGNQIYHTNVMMSVGSRFAFICLEAIQDLEQREKVVKSLEATRKEILDITFDQMGDFLGNVIELHNEEGKKFIVMSATARKSLTEEQRKKLTSYCRLLSPQLDFIEANGGGSARCMIAELF